MMLTIEVGPAALGDGVEISFFVRLESAQLPPPEPQTLFVIREDIGPKDFGVRNPLVIPMSPEGSEPAVLVPS